MTFSVMYIFFILIILIFILPLLFNNSNKNVKNFVKKLYSYRLDDETYITSVQHVYYENKIKLITFAKEKHIKISKCDVVYNKYSEKCDISFVYRNDFYNFNLFEIKTLSNLIPKILILNNINIIIPKSNRNIKHKFVSCYALMSNFDRPLLLSELIESNINFGVSKLVFYYFSSSVMVKKILKYYSDIGIADVYEFQNDTYFKEKEAITIMNIYHFILFKINHCFNEYKTEYNHMMFLDLDEIIWPVRSKSYEDMLLSIPQKDLYNLYSYIFKGNFEIPNHLDKSITTILPDIDLFSIKKYCPSNDRFVHKYIIFNTSKFVNPDIHDPVALAEASSSWIPGDIAFIRHTRHFNDEIKKRCPNSKLMEIDSKDVEKIILSKSKEILNKIQK